MTIHKMEIFCKQLSKKSHYIFLAQEVSSRGGAGGEGGEGGEKEGGPEGGHLRRRPLGSRRRRRGEPGYKQIHKNKKTSRIFLQIHSGLHIDGGAALQSSVRAACYGEDACPCGLKLGVLS